MIASAKRAAVLSVESDTNISAAMREQNENRIQSEWVTICNKCAAVFNNFHMILL